MKGISDPLLELLARWCEEHETGQITLNVADHAIKTYELRERGKVSELPLAKEYGLGRGLAGR